MKGQGGQPPCEKGKENGNDRNDAAYKGTEPYGAA